MKIIATLALIVLFTTPLTAQEAGDRLRITTADSVVTGTLSAVTGSDFILTGPAASIPRADFLLVERHERHHRGRQFGLALGGVFAVAATVSPFSLSGGDAGWSPGYVLLGAVFGAIGYGIGYVLGRPIPRWRWVEVAAPATSLPVPGVPTGNRMVAAGYGFAVTASIR